MLCVAGALYLAAGKPRGPGDSRLPESAVPAEEGNRPAPEPEVRLSEGRSVESDAAFQIDNCLVGLSLRDKIAQLFLVNLSGNSRFVPVDFDQDKKPLIPGGYLFFSYNIAETSDTVREFTSSIRDFCIVQGKIPPYLAIDHEGGSVNRLRNLVSPALPSAREVAEALSPRDAESLYRIQGQRLAELGFHLNVAPVVEIETPDNTEFIHGRSFGSPEQAALFGRAAVAGYRRGGIQSAVKHFPGNTNDDPHTGFPEIAAAPEELEALYIAPFREVLKSDPAAALMSHARTAFFDPGRPACLSYFWVTRMLREQLGFNGLIISDDRYMAVLGKNGFPPETAAIMAIEAGIDVIMISEKRCFPLVEALERKAASEADFAQKIDRAARRVLEFKSRCG
ncbi:MAG: hypothetical protein LBS97_01290, partial [Treponema sp.]|nr:hypothetical protein [Treponema sp.]